MARELGPSYMPFLCEVLSAALPDKGYTAHVLGHTVHALVEAMHKVRSNLQRYWGPAQATLCLLWSSIIHRVLNLTSDMKVNPKSWTFCRTRRLEPWTSQWRCYCC